MQLTTTKKDNKTVEIKMKDEDISIADILHHELLEDKDIVFAGVAPPHPLLGENILIVQSKSSNPMKIIKKSLKKSSEQINEFIKELEKLL